MESTLSATTTTLIKTLNSNSTPSISHLHRHLSTARPIQLLHLPLCRILLRNGSPGGSNGFGSKYSLRSLAWSRLECVSNSAASFASGGGGFGGKDDSGSGDSSAEGGEAKPTAVAGETDDVSTLSSDVIILDVGGMTCGGCAASVKRILESQPQVTSASVDLTTETAIVWPVSEAKVVPNWQTQLGEALAKHLTSCGFKSNLQGQGAIQGDVSL